MSLLHCRRFCTAPTSSPTSLVVARRQRYLEASTCRRMPATLGWRCAVSLCPQVACRILLSSPAGRLPVLHVSGQGPIGPVASTGVIQIKQCQRKTVTKPQRAQCMLLSRVTSLSLTHATDTVMPRAVRSEHDNRGPMPCSCTAVALQLRWRSRRFSS